MPKYLLCNIEVPARSSLSMDAVAQTIDRQQRVPYGEEVSNVRKVVQITASKMLGEMSKWSKHVHKWEGREWSCSNDDGTAKLCYCSTHNKQQTT